MEQKQLVGIIYIKDGHAVVSPERTGEKTDLMELAQFYNDSGIDKLICIDLSSEDDEHEKNLLAIKEINRTIEIKTCGGGNINRLEDVKKLLYAGCSQVVINGSKPNCSQLVMEAAARFGQSKIIVSLETIDFLFKARDFMNEAIDELLIMNKDIVASVSSQTDIPCIVYQSEENIEEIVHLLNEKNITGIYGSYINDGEEDIMGLKATLSDRGISMDNFEPALSWSDLKPQADGLVPVVVQDYKTQEVLMVAYMNEESFNTTIRIGKMTYYSRSRSELWIKGMTSGHIQYVKSLTADCDYDTILAKVSQVGGIACHTGAPSCFFNKIVKKDYVERNPLAVFENVYGVISDRKTNPKEGSYTNYLFDKGLDKILKKVGEEAAEIIIAAKNPNTEETVYEISDFLYHLMVLMAERGITWDEITRELSQR